MFKVTEPLKTKASRDIAQGLPDLPRGSHVGHVLAD